MFGAARFQTDLARWPAAFEDEASGCRQLTDVFPQKAHRFLGKNSVRSRRRIWSVRQQIAFHCAVFINLEKILVQATQEEFGLPLR